MAPPFLHRRPFYESTVKDAIMDAALDGNLHHLKEIVKILGEQKSIFSFKMDGIGVLQYAASEGHLEVCKYLVEELGGDVNAHGAGGMTPFMASALSDDVPTVEYFIDRGCDLMKADDKGRTGLHLAVITGCCKVTEFLLSKGVPVDIDCGRGTPLFHATNKDQDKTLKILLEHHANPNTIIYGIGPPLLNAAIHRSLKCMKLLVEFGADVNGKGSLNTPLVFLTGVGGNTKSVEFLLKAGADPDIPNELGQLPIELAGRRDCKEEVEMLFPLTSPNPIVPNWSIDGIISYAKIQKVKRLDQKEIERRTIILKSHGDDAFKIKQYKLASFFYGLAIGNAPNATLYANRSLCQLLMGDGEGALCNALRSRMLRPNWAKACYRQAAAHMQLKEYKRAYDALLDAQKLDPTNVEIENELRKAREFLKKHPNEREQ